MRVTGTVDDPRTLRAHDHVAWCDDDPDGLGKAAAAVFAGAVDTDRLILLCEGAPEAHLTQIPDADELVRTGRLLVGDTRETYLPVLDGGDFDARAQLAAFEEALAGAFADGYSAMRVVAENTIVLRGDDAMTQRWHEWEQVTDRWQSTRPATGVCYFDTSQISQQRLSDVVGLHPRLCGARPSPLRIVSEPEVLRLGGAAEAHDDARLRRVFELAEVEGRLTIDLADVDYLHHRIVLDLARLAAQGVHVELRNAPPIVRRLCAVLANETVWLKFV